MLPDALYLYGCALEKSPLQDPLVHRQVTSALNGWRRLAGRTAEVEVLRRDEIFSLSPELADASTLTAIFHADRSLEQRHTSQLCFAAYSMIAMSVASTMKLAVATGRQVPACALPFEKKCLDPKLYGLFGWNLASPVHISGNQQLYSCLTVDLLTA